MSSADNITISVVIVDVKRDNFTEWIISALVNEFRMDCGEDTVQSEIHIIKNAATKMTAKNLQVPLKILTRSMDKTVQPPSVLLTLLSLFHKILLFYLMPWP